MGLLGNMAHLKAEEKLNLIRTGAFSNMSKESQQEMLHEVESVLRGEDEADKSQDTSRHLDFHRQIVEAKTHGL